MSYTVWMDGNKIGETAFEFRHGSRKRAGVFHPTKFGLTVLPGITAMFPALLETGQACRELGLSTEDAALDAEAVAERVFETPAGRRVLAAASQISQLVLQGPSGELVLWDSMLISDLNELSAVAARAAGNDQSPSARPDGPPIRYLISATLTNTGISAKRLWSHREPVS